MAKGTPATLALQRAGVAFTLHEYDYDRAAARIGLQAAEALGIAPERLLKTLMAKAGAETICVLIAADREVNLKALERVAGTKDAALLPPAEAERITGYHVGGISPLGQRRKARTFIDAAALQFPSVLVNGGRRGLQIEIDPTVLLALLEAQVADLASLVRLTHVRKTPTPTAAPPLPYPRSP